MQRTVLTAAASAALLLTSSAAAQRPIPLGPPIPVETDPTDGARLTRPVDDAFLGQPDHTDAAQGFAQQGPGIPVKFEKPVKPQQPDDSKSADEQFHMQWDDEDVSYALNQMSDQLAMGRPIDADLQRLRKKVTDITDVTGGSDEDDSEAGEMLAAIDALAHRAKGFYIDDSDLGVLRKRLFWARLDASVKLAAQFADDSDHGVARMVSDLSATLPGLATAYVPHKARPVQDSIQQVFVRVQAVASTPDQFQRAVRAQLVQSRLRAARQVLAQRLSDNTQTRGDYMAVYRLIRLRVAIIDDESNQS